MMLLLLLLLLVGLLLFELCFGWGVRLGNLGVAVVLVTVVFAGLYRVFCAETVLVYDGEDIPVRDVSFLGLCFISLQSLIAINTGWDFGDDDHRFGRQGARQHPGDGTKVLGGRNQDDDLRRPHGLRGIRERPDALGQRHIGQVEGVRVAADRRKDNNKLDLEIAKMMETRKRGE